MSTSSSSQSLSSSSSSSSLSTSSSSTSRSTSSSSSSVDSSSSSSSSSRNYSSSSSYSSSSLSSRSSLSTSSSSSIDSSSSSSESIGNVSSSSSSSLEILERSKPLILGNSAIYTGTIANQISQSILFENETLDIGKIHLYLFGPYGDLNASSLILSIFSCDSSGVPVAEIISSSLSGAEINGDKWYSFTFDQSVNVPDNGWLSFVLRMEDMDEDNYALWGYSEYEGETAKAFVFVESGWVVHPGISRGLKVGSRDELFDLDNFQIVSRAGSITTQTAVFSAEDTFTNTKLENSPDRVQLSPPKTIVSVVADGSGSMGWNDRLANRTSFIDKMFTKMGGYGNEFLFDFVRVGAIQIETDNFSTSFGSVQPVSLDLNRPDRSPFMFESSALVEVSNGAVYESQDGKSFTVSIGGTYTNKVYMLGALSTDISEGTLTKVSGDGAGSITYVSIKSFNPNGEMAAFGFKNLENSHSYVFSGIEINNTQLSNPSLINSNLFHPSSESPQLSMQDNGPDGISALNILASANAVFRMALPIEPLAYANISEDIPKDTTIATVQQPENIVVGQRYDLVYGAYLYPNMEVSSINGNQIVFSEPVGYDIPGFDKANSIVQDSVFGIGKPIQGTTIQLFVLDRQSSRNITLFLQTSEGVSFEWDFTPAKEWKKSNIYWIGETAKFDFYAVDKDGDEIQDGTKLELFVDNAVVSSTATTIKLVSPAPSGSDTIYVDSISGLARDDRLNIISSSATQEVKVYELGDSGSSKYIEIYGTLDSYFPIGAELSKKEASSETLKNIDSTYNSAVVAPLSISDITPILAGRNLSPSELTEYDTNPTPYNTTYDQLNNSADYISSSPKNIPTIDGFAALRFLPITEDIFRTVEQKQKEAQKILQMSREPDILSQLPKDNDESSPVSTGVAEKAEDYTIESPVYFYSAKTKSAMTSYATELTPKTFSGLNVPGSSSSDVTLPTKTYDIYPQIVVEDENGATVGKQELQPIEVNFVSPINIEYINDYFGVYYWIWDSENEEWTKKYLNGSYATSGLETTVSFRVSNKLNLVNNDTISVRIYQNKIVDLEKAAEDIYQDVASKTFVNKKPYTKTITVDGVSTTETVQTELDNWRDFVLNNASPEQGEDGSFGFYKSSSQWTLAADVSFNNYSAKVTNGYVEVVMPVSNTPCIYMVEASRDIPGTKLEIITSAFVFNANPLVVEPISPEKLTPKTGTDKFEVAVGVKWMGGYVFENGVLASEDGVIENGTVVSVSPAETEVEPSVSQTVDGTAYGLIIGPHPVVVCRDGTSCKDIETVVVRVNSPSTGISNTVSRNIQWLPYTEQKPTNKFFIYVEPISQTIWADGEDSIPLNIDLLSDNNKQVFIEENGMPVVFVGEYGANRLLGLEQPGNLPTYIYNTSENAFSPPSQRWTSQNVVFYSPPVNETVGVNGKKVVAEFTTSYFFVDSNGVTQENKGYVVSSVPVFDAEANDWLYDVPEITVIEPLSISLEIESDNNIFPRDGVSSVNVVASVNWKGEPIRPKIKINSGKPNETTISYPLPEVIFNAGVCTAENVNESDAPIDPRGPKTACLRISEHPSVSLNKYTVQSEISRTDIHTDDNGNKHTHACVVDDNGNGTTTSTITLSGAVEPHEHNITNYVAGASLNHTHELRCVAITQINPTSNTSVNIAVNGTVTYDPTNSAPWTGYNSENEGDSPFKNRKAFNTVRSDGFTPSERELKIDFIFGNNLKDNYVGGGSTAYLPETLTFYTSETATDPNGGFDLKAKVYYSSYTTELAPGVPVVIPEEPVPDGTRVRFNIEPFAPKPSAEYDYPVISYKNDREYLYLRINAEVCVDGEYKEQNSEVVILSKLQWLPGVKALVRQPTNDSIDKNDALSKINYLGASQIYDGISLAAQRAITYVNDNNLSGYQHMILVLTDGDENMSTRTVSQSINDVGFISGAKNTPAIVVRTGNSYVSDHAILKKIVNDTDGLIISMKNYDSVTIDKCVDEILIGDKAVINSGVYSGTIDFISSVTIRNASLGNVYVPASGDLYFRVRASEDKLSWTEWSDWKKYDENISDIALSKRYLNYECKFLGNAEFESPIMYEGLSLDFVQPKTTIVYFEPIQTGAKNDEYLSSIHVTHQGSIPAESTVQFGINSNDSLNPDEFRNLQQDWIKPDEYSILLSRANEILNTENYIRYFAAGGAWTEGATVEVRRYSAENSDGELINPSEYSVIPSEGLVSFYLPQNKSAFFTITILFNSSFRMICRIENQTEEAAKIDHIAVMYSVLKRISSRPYNIRRR